jgi:hypothetical protein
MWSACIPLLVRLTLVPISVTVSARRAFPQLRHGSDEPEVDYPENEHDDVLPDDDAEAVQVAELRLRGEEVGAC